VLEKIEIDPLQRYFQNSASNENDSMDESTLSQFSKFSLKLQEIIVNPGIFSKQVHEVSQTVLT
jgi:hypothetical protein